MPTTVRFEDDIVIAPAPSLTVAVDNDSICIGSGAQGELTAITDGDGAYTYLWSDGQTTQTATELVAGTYAVTVTDTESSCTVEASAEVIESDLACNELGNYAWFDANQNGIQDNLANGQPETPVAGLVVDLYNRRRRTGRI